MFIELNAMIDGQILVNTDHVKKVCKLNSENNTAVIEFTHGDIMGVNETYDQVLLVIRTAMKQKYGRKKCTQDS